MNADEIVKAARGLCARSLTGLNKYHGYIATKSSKHGEGVYDAIIERLYRHEHGIVPELCDLIESLQAQLSASQRQLRAAVEGSKQEREMGCEYCADHEDLAFGHDSMKRVGSIYIDGNLLVADLYSESMAVAVCYCPMCGKSLKEVANER